MVYVLEYLPIARQDMIEIVKYIAFEIGNSVAAENLANQIIQSVEQLQKYPYANPAYMPIRPLEQEYRKMVVENYLVFYCVNDQQKKITIMRIIYACSNYEKNSILD